MSVSPRTCALSFCLAFACITLSAQASDDAEFQKWFRRVWDAGNEYPLPPTGLHLRFSLAISPRVTPEELSKLRAEVAGHPQHPALSRLHDLEQVQKGLPLGGIYDLWLSGGSWRINEPISNAPSEWMDACIRYDQNLVWSSSVGGLLTLGHANSQIPTGYDIRPEEPTVRKFVWLFPTGGLALASTKWFVFSKPVLKGDTWRCHTKNTLGTVAIDIEGTWDESTHLGSIRREIGKTISGGAVVGSYFADGWVYNDAYGLNLPTTVTESAVGKPPEVWTLLLAEKVDAKEFDRVTAAPKDGVDAVRGAIRVSTFEDFSASIPSTTTIDGGVKTVRPFDEETSHFVSTARLVGVLVVATSLLVFGGIRLKALKRKTLSAHRSTKET